MALHMEPRTQQSYKQEMAAHARWMKKAKLDREAFTKEMSELDAELDSALAKMDAESDALDAEADALESSRCVWCGGFDCKSCEAEFEKGAALAAERSGK